MFSNNEHMCVDCQKGLPACTCNKGGFNQQMTGLSGFQSTGLQQTTQMTGLNQTGFTQGLVGHTHTHNQGLLGAASTGIRNVAQGVTGMGMGGSHRLIHEQHLGLGQNRLETCNVCLGTEILEVRAPIIERIEERPVVITHHEGQVVETHGGQTIVQTHQEAAQVRQHIEQPIVKEIHQNVIHEHHKDILHEHRQNIVHEHHQPIIHEVHQPIIHEKHIHEIHQPIIHEKHQTLVEEAHKNIIHEKKEFLVHEQQKEAVVHEKTAQPIVHCNKEAAPIVKDLGIRENFQGEFREGFVEGGLGGEKVTTITETIVEKDIGTTGLGTGLGTGHLHSHNKIGRDLATGETLLHAEEPYKKSFGQKIKEVFTGRTNEPTHLHGNAATTQGTLGKQL